MSERLLEGLRVVDLGGDPSARAGRVLGDLGALEAELRRGDVAALIVEPVQGHGVMMTPPGFLPEAKALLHKSGALLICDEVQVGLGRTGRLVTSAALILFLAFVALAASPGTEIRILATGLAAGILLDATVVRALVVPALVTLLGKANWWAPWRQAGSAPT